MCFANSLVFGTPKGELIEQQLTENDYGDCADQLAFQRWVSSLNTVRQVHACLDLLVQSPAVLSAFTSNRCIILIGLTESRCLVVST